MLYNTASSINFPSLYLCLARNVLGRVPLTPCFDVLGRVPLTPCFVRGNRTPTLPHSFGKHQGAVADNRNVVGNGSRLYEVNIWMWRFGPGRGQPRRVTVAEAELQRKAAISDARRRAAGTQCL